MAARHLNPSADPDPSSGGGLGLNPSSNSGLNPSGDPSDAERSLDPSQASLNRVGLNPSFRFVCLTDDATGLRAEVRLYIYVCVCVCVCVCMYVYRERGGERE